MTHIPVYKNIENNNINYHSDIILKLYIKIVPTFEHTYIIHIFITRV